MTISRPDVRRATRARRVFAGLMGAGLMGAGLLMTGAAHAQQQPPVTAEPLGAPAPYGAPAYGPAPRRDAGVEVASLPAAAPDGGGVIDPGQGGYPGTVWGASYRPLIERAFVGLPATSASPAVRDIVRRLALSIATPPTGMPTLQPGSGSGSGGGGLGIKPRDFAGLRLERVALLGDVRAADDMARLPTALNDVGGARAWATLNLLAGDGYACERLPDLSKRFADPEIQMASIICQARAGQTDGIALALDILREQGGKDDAFTRLAESAAGGQKGALKGLTALSAPTVALARALARGLPADLPVASVMGLGGAAAAAVVDLPDTPAPLRLAAGDRAAALGRLGAAPLADLYKAAKVSPGDLKNAVTVAAQKRGVDQRALLYQALVGEQTPSLKAKVIARAVDIGDPALLAGVWGLLLTDQLEGLIPGPDLVDLAPRAARLLLLQGQGDRARAWLAVAKAATDDKGQAAYRALLPLAVIGGAVPTGQTDWGQWLSALKVEDDAQARAKAGGLLALLVACGERVDPQALARVVDAGTAAGPVPSAPAWLQLDQAATGGRQGETALLALGELPEAGPAAAPPLVATHVVGALASVGLMADARRIAVEAAAALVPPSPTGA